MERASGRRRDNEDAGAKAGADGRRTVLPKFDKKTIALVYDFDGTLSHKPMQASIRSEPFSSGADPKTSMQVRVVTDKS